MPTVLRESTPRARKPYPCALCGVDIRTGQRHRVVVTVGDYGGDLGSWRYCLLCDEVLHLMWAFTPCDYQDEGIGPDEALEWARENHADPRYGQTACAYLERRGIQLGSDR
jgi:hypothetical protein